jgi:hypothetical protein
VVQEWINYTEIICENDPFISLIINKMLLTDAQVRPDFTDLANFIADEELTLSPIK